MLLTTTVGFKYLGGFLSASADISWDRNVLAIWSRVSDELKVWSRMPLSLPCRSSIFKMVSLPRLLYHLQNYPFRIPPSWFRQVNSVLGQFLWAGKVPRVALRTCFQSTYSGGLATSDILSYYMAAHLLVLNEWWYGDRADPANALERERMGTFTIHTILYSAPIRRALPSATNVIFDIWKQALRKIRWWGRLTKEIPLWSNGRLPQFAGLAGFRAWDILGISTMGDVMQGMTLKSFQQLQWEFRCLKLNFINTSSFGMPSSTVLLDWSPYQILVP